MTHLSSFIQFHRANPRVWELFQAFTRQIIAAGRDHYSSLYARLFHLAHPQHGRFFELRALSDERDVDRDLRALLQ